MLQVLRSSWALLLGMLLLMIGNGLQGTLLGVRGDIESFTTFEMSIVISAYFLGFLGGSRLAPALYPPRGPCACFCGAGLYGFGGLNSVSSVDESNFMDCRAGFDRLLLFWHLCDGRKLA